MRKIVQDMARVLKNLGYVPPTANHGRKARFSTEEIKWISKETGIEEYKIYMKFG